MMICIVMAAANGAMICRKVRFMFGDTLNSIKRMVRHIAKKSDTITIALKFIVRTAGDVLAFILEVPYLVNV